jgi:hypothetical protein
LALTKWIIVSPSVCAAGTGMSHLFAIHVQGDGALVGEHRERGRWNRAAAGGRGEAPAELVTRDDRDAQLGRILVAAGVVGC